MEFVHVNKKYYCGIDLHADVMYVCVLDKKGRKKFFLPFKEKILT